MKHLRKIGIIIIAVIMVAAIAVGVCVVFAVRNVNVTFLSYPDEDENLNSEIQSVKQGVLDSVRGRVIYSVGEEDVASGLAQEYYLESFEKVYPCTLNITVRQRREVFSVFDGENYSVYDDSGKFLRVSDKNLNAVDNAPNLIIEGTNSEAEIKEVAAVCAIFKSNASSLRSAVEKVTLKKSQTSISTDSDRIIFSLRCGIVIEIQDYGNYTAEKISKAYNYFGKLSTDQKLKGIIYSREYGGEIVVDYSANV